MLHPTPRTWLGKTRQALWAVRLERHLGKQAILEQYLNRVPLGQGTVGVEAAAALYFSTGADALSLGQAALLAGLAPAPSSDNPLGVARSGRATAGAERSSGWWISASRPRPPRSGPAREPLLERRRAGPFLAAHFTTSVLRWAERDGTAARGTWRTSLDLALQEELEQEVRHAVATLADRGARHAAAVVLDNRSGQVLAWVGSPDFWADTAGQVDMVVSARQPGSALKPFLYALAFDRGWTPASVLPDIARVYQTGTGPYRPRNYDRRFHGPVRAREALGSSYNVPAVELASRLSVGSLLHVLRGAGFGSLGRSADHYGLGLALGNGDVTLLELANGYRGLVNLGVWRPYTWRARDARPIGRSGESLRRRARRRLGARHPRRPGGAHTRVRPRVAARLPLSRRGQDRHQPALHRQLGGGRYRRIHRGGLGRELQRTADGRREWRQRCGPAAASRGARDRATLSPGDPARSARCGRGSRFRLPALRSASGRPTVQWHPSGSLPTASRPIPVLGTRTTGTSRYRSSTPNGRTRVSAPRRSRPGNGRGGSRPKGSRSSRRATATCTGCLPALRHAMRRSLCARPEAVVMRRCGGRSTACRTRRRAGVCCPAAIGSAPSLPPATPPR